MWPLLLPCAIASLSATNLADGAPPVTRVGWRAVDNSAATPGIAGWVAGSRTFDLYAFGISDRLCTSFDAGGVPNQLGLGIRVIGGPVYNHPLGSDTRSTPIEPLPGFTEIRFDTYCCFGGVPAPGGPGGAQTSFGWPFPDLSGDDGSLTFTTFTTPPVPLQPDPNSPGGGSLWVLRVTLPPSTRQIGGGDSHVRLFIEGAGLDSAVPYALPPGAAQAVHPTPNAVCIAVDPAPQFVWMSAESARTYSLRISTDPGFTTTHYAADGLSAPSHTPPLWTLDRGQTYFWRVAAVNEAGETPSGVATASTAPAGDVDQDGRVGFLDLNHVLSSFGAVSGGPGYDRRADLNHDDVVNFIDLNVVLSAYGAAC